MVGCSTPSVDKQLGDGFLSDTIKANSGDPLAAFDVGIVYYLGYARGRTQDGLIHYKLMNQNNALAYKYLKISADNGNIQAAALIGGLLMGGNGIPKNQVEAIKYFEQSKNKFFESRSALSQIYIISPDKSIQKNGYDLVSNAQQTGDPEMIKTLSLYYSKGVVAKKDLARASELNKMADSIRMQNIEKLKARIAAIEDSRASQRKYSKNIDQEDDRLQLQKALLAIFLNSSYKMVNNMQTFKQSGTTIIQPNNNQDDVTNNSEPFSNNRSLTIQQLIDAGIL